MDHIYQINTKLEIPIYQQLVDSIRAAVKRGVLPADTQLPTVQELSTRLAVARGTIKRAYDELERLGIVEKVQGRGTFVSYRPEHSGSRKEQAMAAIDKLLSDLEEQGFSTAEINIFLNLKLRDRAEQESKVKIAVLECNPENLSRLSDQLRTIPNTDIYAYLVETVREYPYKLEEGLDLLVTTAAHGDFLEQILPEGKRMAKVALRLTRHSLSDIIKLRRGKNVAILCYSKRFGNLLYTTCQTYTEGLSLTSPVEFSAMPELDAFLQGKDTVLVPQDYEKYCSSQQSAALERFTGKIIECSYELDEGSFIYLQEKTKRLLEDKSLA